MDELGALGGEDLVPPRRPDLATHLYRTQRLADGATLSQVTAEITGPRAWRSGCCPCPTTPSAPG